MPCASQDGRIHADLCKLLLELPRRKAGGIEIPSRNSKAQRDHCGGTFSAPRHCAARAQRFSRLARDTRSAAPLRGRVPRPPRQVPFHQKDRSPERPSAPPPDKLTIGKRGDKKCAGTGVCDEVAHFAPP